MADQDARALLLTIQANTELLRSNLSAAEKAIEGFTKSTESHLDETDRKFALFGKSIESLEGPLERLKKLGEFAIGALIGESLLEAGKKGLEFAGNVKFVSEQVGTSTKFLQEYRFAAGQFGVGTAEADEGLNKFARSIGQAANGNKTMIELFNRLGVNIRDTAGNVRSVESVFLDTANAIQKIDNPAQKSADTLALLGKGSAGLIPLLSAGAHGFSQLAEAAQQLGVVLSPELIDHSEEVNHKLAALKQILDAQLSSAIAQNASSIESLATSFVKLAGGIAQFLNGHPERALTIMGAFVGSRVGGLPGAALGAIAGNLAGNAIKAQDDEDNNDLGFRKRALKESAQAYIIAHNTPSAEESGYASERGGGLAQDASASEAAAQAAYRHQRELYQRALRAPKAGGEGGLGSDHAGATNDNGDDLKAANERLGHLQELQAHASGDALKGINQEIVEQKRKIGFIKQGADAELAGSLAAKQGAAQRSGESAAKSAQRKAEELRQKDLSADISYSADVRKLREQLLEGMRKTSTNEAERDALQKEGINAEADAAKVQNQLKFAKGDLGSDPRVAAARLANLDGLVEQNRLQKLANVDIARQSANVAQQYAASAQNLQNQQELLQIQDQMATTAAERRKLELQLLDISQQQVRAALQKVLDDKSSSDAERDAAKSQLAALPKIEAAQRGQVVNNTQGPGEQYRRSLNLSPDEKGELVQGKEVSLLEEFNQGLDSSITKTLHLHGILGQIVGDLADMILKQALFKPIAQTLFGGSSGGGGGGFGGILGSIGKLFGGGGGGSGFSLSSNGGSGLGNLNTAFDPSLPGLAGGGSFMIGGRTGIDRNLLSINGRPVVRVNNGERVAVIPPSMPSASRIGEQRAQATQVVLHVQANDYFDAKVAGISGGQINQAAPHIAAGGAGLAATNAARSRRRSLA